MDLINNLIQNSSKAYWIGLSDATEEGKWIWDDGSDLDFTFWRGGEPNDWGGREDCVHIRANQRWNDINCNNKAAFICEYPE